MHIQSLSQAGCLASARAWRAHADILRANAQSAQLQDHQRAVLAREAEAADRQADSWLDAAEEE
jgi:hypothetical protein